MSAGIECSRVRVKVRVRVRVIVRVRVVHRVRVRVALRVRIRVRVRITIRVRVRVRVRVRIECSRTVVCHSAARSRWSLAALAARPFVHSECFASSRHGGGLKTDQI